MHTKLSPKINTYLEQIAHEIEGRYSIAALAVGGSMVTNAADESSDVDVYVYAKKIVPENIREEIILPKANNCMIGNNFWEPGDEWVDKQSGLEIDMMYRTIDWIETELSQVLDKHEAKVGYTTALWYNVKHSKIVYDPHGWFQQLQQRYSCEYPIELRKNIIGKNMPILRDKQSSYKDQVEKAINRGDLVSVNHRIAALLSSYFDILFAINETPHPGEKRMLEHALAQCKVLPTNMSQNLGELLAPSEYSKSQLMKVIDVLIDNLEAITPNLDNSK